MKRINQMLKSLFEDLSGESSYEGDLFTEVGYIIEWANQRVDRQSRRELCLRYRVLFDFGPKTKLKHSYTTLCGIQHPHGHR